MVLWQTQTVKTQMKCCIFIWACLNAIKGKCNLHSLESNTDFLNLSEILSTLFLSINLSPCKLFLPLNSFPYNIHVLVYSKEMTNRSLTVKSNFYGIVLM